jgi:hypothetical protein
MPNQSRHALLHVQAAPQGRIFTDFHGQALTRARDRPAFPFLSCALDHPPATEAPGPTLTSTRGFDRLPLSGSASRMLAGWGTVKGIGVGTVLDGVLGS